MRRTVRRCWPSTCRGATGRRTSTARRTCAAWTRTSPRRTRPRPSSRRRSSAFGAIDILVNNAGIAIGAQFEDTTDEQWERILAINVTAIFRLSKAAVPHIKARGGGRIINLGSIMSNTAGPNLAAYGTTKHAVAGLSKGMAVDLGKYKITVNYLQPGSIWTALSQPFFDDPNFRKYWEAKAPMGRIGDPEDVAAAALFLATDEAKFVSGAGVAVDGGAAINF